MKVEIFEWIPDEERTEYRVYEIAEGMVRILVDSRRGGEVWGFDAYGKQCEAILVEKERQVIVFA